MSFTEGGANRSAVASSASLALLDGTAHASAYLPNPPRPGFPDRQVGTVSPAGARCGRIGCRLGEKCASSSSASLQVRRLADERPAGLRRRTGEINRASPRRSTMQTPATDPDQLLAARIVVGQPTAGVVKKSAGASTTAPSAVESRWRAVRSGPWRILSADVRRSDDRGCAGGALSSSAGHASSVNRQTGTCANSATPV